MFSLFLDHCLHPVDGHSHPYRDQEHEDVIHEYIGGIILQGMEQRLLSRFKWGLQADLQRPDYETRLAILKKKAYNDGIELPDEIFEFLAISISNNIRELEAVLISLSSAEVVKITTGIDAVASFDFKLFKTSRPLTFGS